MTRVFDFVGIFAFISSASFISSSLLRQQVFRTEILTCLWYLRSWARDWITPSVRPFLPIWNLEIVGCGMRLFGKFI